MVKSTSLLESRRINITICLGPLEAGQNEFCDRKFKLHDKAIILNYKQFAKIFSLDISSDEDEVLMKFTTFYHILSATNGLKSMLIYNIPNDIGLITKLTSNQSNRYTIVLFPEKNVEKLIIDCYDKTQLSVIVKSYNQFKELMCNSEFFNLVKSRDIPLQDRTIIASANYILNQVSKEMNLNLVV